MIVRRATLDDLSQYLELAVQFHAACPVRDAVPFDPSGFADFFASALQQNNMAIWCAEHDGKLMGIAGAIHYGLYFSPTSTVAQELWWFVAPPARGTAIGRRLKTALEEWAKEQGAVAVFMIALEDDAVAKVSDIYLRNGYRPMERTFFKEVS